jgi:hypothetical protein
MSIDYKSKEQTIIKIQNMFRQKKNKNILNINNFKNLLVENNIIESLKNEWNNKKLIEFQELAYGKEFKEIFKNDKTQEITKQISFWLYIILEKLMCEKIPKLKIDKKEKRDYIYDTTPIEAKITFSENNSWTGNGTKKTPWHLLLKIKLDENGIIEGCFCMLANIVECGINWTEPKKSKKGGPVNFSTLTFSNECYDKIKIIYGKAICSEKRINLKIIDKYAKKYDIDFPNKSIKKDKLDIIKSYLKNLDKNAIDEWNELISNPEGKIYYKY